MDIKKIIEKIKDTKTYEEAKEILTPEELICYMYRCGKEADRDQEGDEYLIIEIVKILAQKGYSVRHSLYLLDRVKETVLSLVRLTI